TATPNASAIENRCELSLRSAGEQVHGLGSECRKNTRRRERSPSWGSRTGGSRTHNRYRRCFLSSSSFVRLFFVSDNERRAYHRGDPHFSRTCNDYFVNDFRNILRINPGAKIDSSRCKNIRAPAGIAAQVDTDDAAIGTSLLSKICDLEEAIVRDRDRDW